MTKYFYSKFAGLQVTVPDEFGSVNKKLVGKVLAFTPLGSASNGAWSGGQWGMFAAGPEEAEFFAWRKAMQGENPDVVEQETFNAEMQIEAKGARNVLQDTLNEIKAKSKLLNDLVTQGVLNPDFTPVIAKMPDEVKKGMVDAAAQQSILGDDAPQPGGKQRVGIK